MKVLLNNNVYEIDKKGVEKLNSLSNSNDKELILYIYFLEKNYKPVVEIEAAFNCF